MESKREPEPIWEEPREITTSKRLHVRQDLIVLEANPRRWARMYTFERSNKASALSQYIRTLGGFESTSRRLFEGEDQGKYAVFVRFVGDAK